MKKLCIILVMFVCAFGTTTVFAGGTSSGGYDTGEVTEETCDYFEKTSCNNAFDEVLPAERNYSGLKSHTQSNGFTDECYNFCYAERGGCNPYYHLIIVKEDGCKNGYHRKEYTDVDLLSQNCEESTVITLYECEADCEPTYSYDKWAPLNGYDGVEEGIRTNSCDNTTTTVYRCADNYGSQGEIFETPNKTNCECSLSPITTKWESYDPDPGIEQQVTTDGCGDGESYKYRCAKGYFSKNERAEAGDPDDLGCVSCADQTGVTGATTRSEASISIQACYVPQDTKGSDSTGDYEFTEDCVWGQN